MPSSDSTLSPPAKRSPRLLLRVVGDDDPKVCTGLRLVRFGRARRVGDIGRLHPPPLLLDPHAPLPLSRADARTAREGGILAIDCSWNRLSERAGILGPRRRERGGPVHRRLPYLLAANPQHFGRMGELNTVEALSAALHLLGYREAAAKLLEGFRGGPSFLEVNRVPLARFGAGRTPEEVLTSERSFYGGSSSEGPSKAAGPDAPRAGAAPGRPARRTSPFR